MPGGQGSLDGRDFPQLRHRQRGPLGRQAAIDARRTDRGLNALGAAGEPSRLRERSFGRRTLPMTVGPVTSLPSASATSAAVKPSRRKSRNARASRSGVQVGRLAWLGSVMSRGVLMVIYCRQAIVTHGVVKYGNLWSLEPGEPVMADNSWKDLELPDRVKWARSRRFKSATAAAKALGMEAGTYRCYERGPDSAKYIPLDYKHAQPFAREFKVRWEWLLDGLGKPWLNESDAEPDTDEEGKAPNNLRAWREYRSLTVAELAKKSGLGTQTITELEAGRMDASRQACSTALAFAALEHHAGLHPRPRSQRRRSVDLRYRALDPQGAARAGAGDPEDVPAIQSASLISLPIAPIVTIDLTSTITAGHASGFARKATRCQRPLPDT